MTSPTGEHQVAKSLVCPGGQGDVSVYKNLAVHVGGDAEWTCGLRVEGFPPEPAPPADEKRKREKTHIPAGKKSASAA